MTVLDIDPTQQEREFQQDDELTALIGQWSNGDSFHDHMTPAPVAPSFSAIKAFVNKHYVRCALEHTPPKIIFIGSRTEGLDGLKFEATSVNLRQRDFATAFMFTATAGMSLLTGDPGVHLKYIKAKYESFKLVRAKVKQESKRKDAVREVIEYMFRAAALHMDLKEATAHGRALRDMLIYDFTNQGKTPINRAVLHQYLYVDALVAEYFMTAPVFGIYR